MSAKFRLNKTVAALLVASTSTTLGAAIPTYPFSPVPTHLTGGRASVPPNVMLFLDTSLSMARNKVGDYQRVVKEECASPGITFNLTGSKYIQWSGSTCCTDLNGNNTIDLPNIVTKTVPGVPTYKCTSGYTLGSVTELPASQQSKAGTYAIDGQVCTKKTSTGMGYTYAFAKPTVAGTTSANIQYYDDKNTTSELTVTGPDSPGQVQTVSCKVESPATRVETLLPLGTATKTRAEVAQTAALAVLDRYPNMRWGLSTFAISSGIRNGNWGAQINVPIDDAGQGSQQLQKMKNAITTLGSPAAGWPGFNADTPTTSAYYDLTRYFRGMPLLSRNRNVATASPVLYRCQKNFIIFLSDGYPDTAQNYQGMPNILPTWKFSTSLAGFSGTVKPLGSAYDEDGPFGSKATGQPGTNADPTGVVYTNPPDAPTFPCQTTNTCGGMYTELGAPYFTAIAHTKDMITDSMDLNNGLPKGKDKEGQSWDSGKWATQTIETHTIGMSNNVPTLDFMARNGGGTYTFAANEQELNAALDKILSSIGIAAAPFSGTAPNAAIAQSTDNITTAMATTLNTANWSSQLRFFGLKSDGALDTDLTKAKKATYDPSNSVTLLSLPDKALIMNTTANLSNGDFGLTSTSSDQWKKLVQWLTRSTATDSETGYRNRMDKDPDDRYLGDVIDSEVTTMGLEKKASYTYGNPQQEYIAIGANDGMLHIYQKTGSETQAYKDIFQYIPGAAKRSDNSILAHHLQTPANPDYGRTDVANVIPHQFFVNAPVSWYETETVNNSSRAFLSGALGQGGQAVYALNLDGTQAANAPQAVGLGDTKANWLKSVPLWDTSTSQFGDSSLKSQVDPGLGYVFDTPINGRTITAVGSGSTPSSYRYITLFGSGVNTPPTNASACQSASFPTPCIYPKPTLYIVDSLGLDAKTNTAASDSAPGKVLAKLEVPDANNIDTSSSYGLSQPVAVDITGDDMIDLVYAGDQNGNIYQFDLRGGIGNWQVQRKLIFRGDSAHPIVVAPTAYYNKKTKKMTVLFGTGSTVFPNDLTSTTVQSFYGVQIDPDSQDQFTPYTIGDKGNRLVQREFSEADSTTTPGLRERHLAGDNNPMSVTQSGWYMDFKTYPGERIAAKPVIGGNPNVGATVALSTVIFAPPEQTTVIGCTAPTTKSKGFVMLLDAEQGTKPISFRFTQDKSDLIGLMVNGKPSGMKLLRNQNTATDAYGIALSGKASLNPAGYCANGKIKTIVGSTEEGGKVSNYFCEPSPSGGKVTRISWREIFD